MLVDYYYPPIPPNHAADSARRAAGLGYDGFFSAETGHEPFLPLALASQAAPELTLGTAISLAFPRSPMVMAQLAWDLAALSEGKFLLGLGTQIKPHITRRFSTEWLPAAPRLKDYILAMRAVWDTFQNGTPLKYQGEYYRLTLMTPFFNGGPIAHPDVPVYIAGVGPVLSRLAGEICNGFHIHPFHSIKYLDEVVLPNIEEGAARAGRSLDDVELVSTIFLVTGRDEAEIRQASMGIRQQVAFYASTPSYAPILDTHGWDFGPTLNAMSKRGEWDKMAEVITDEVLAEVAVVGPPEELGEKIRARYGDRVQRLGYYALAGDGLFDDETWAGLIAATKG